MSGHEKITIMKIKTASLPENNDFDNESDKTSVQSENSEVEHAFNYKLEEIKATENFVNSTSEIEPFFIADMRKVKNQYDKWVRCLPSFTPFYAVKCNNNEHLLKTLNLLGASFDCASLEEIRTVLEMGVIPENIIFANPCKSPIHLKYAANVGVSKMTFDNSDELIKVKHYHPNAELIIRIDVDDSKSICQFGVKFGVKPGYTKPLLELAQKLNLKVIGVSFHVGSGCMEASSYNDAIKRARNVFEEAKLFGFYFNFLDIGGGFPGLTVTQNGTKIQFEDIATVVNQSIEEYFSDMKNLTLIGEPGRFFANSAFSLATNITSRRTIQSEHGQSFMYYINDGVYGSFNCLIFDHADLPQPRCLIRNDEDVYHYEELERREKFICSIWGPTCDSMDCLSRSIKLPELNIGDWLIFDNMGAYTLVAASKFNGMSNPEVLYLDVSSQEPKLKPIYITPYEPNQMASSVDEDFVLS